MVRHCGKLRMELIRDEKSRRKTYAKRLKSLKKKAFELQTLCGVDVVLVASDPTTSRLSAETWPESQPDFERITARYRGLSEADRRRWTQTLHSPTTQIDRNSEQPLEEHICSRLDLKLEEVRRRINSLKMKTFSQPAVELMEHAPISDGCGYGWELSDLFETGEFSVHSALAVEEWLENV